MKKCPKCKQQFPNGFQYCPIDTELLITNEENVRNTKPLASTPATERVDQPVVEVVPITNPFPEEVKTPAAPQRSAEQKPVEKPVEPQKPTPYRGTEPIITGQTEPIRPARILQRPAQRASVQNDPAAVINRENQVSQPAGNPWWESQQPVNQRSSAAESEPRLNFALPEGGGLISRLAAGLKNIGEVFKSAPQMIPGAAGDFKFLLQEESLFKRIGRELEAAWTEFRQNPRRFLKDFLSGEGTNRTRRNTLLAGSEMAFVGYFTLYFISEALGGLSKTNPMLINAFFIGFALYLLGCYLVRGFLLYNLIYRVSSKFTIPKVALEFANWVPIAAVLLLAILLNNYGFYCRIFPERCGPTEDMLDEKLVFMAPLADTKIDLALEKSKVAKEKTLGGSKPEPKKASGGGGGGRQEPTPPSKGNPPQMALTPQIIPPDPTPPKIKDPSLVVASTIYGDPKMIPPMKGPIGDPTGIPAPPSSGPGTGAGIGRGGGTGVGGGEGGGAGPGRGGNMGGGDMGIGGGRSVEQMTASLRPTITHREKAKYTEEARQNKVQGTVVLQVVFHANGSITDIRVVRGLPDGLTEKAIEAARKIRFNPAVKNGSPVSVRGTLEFSFNLY
jgi:TonB family protein